MVYTCLYTNLPHIPQKSLVLGELLVEAQRRCVAQLLSPPCPAVLEVALAWAVHHGFWWFSEVEKSCWSFLGNAFCHISQSQNMVWTCLNHFPGEWDCKIFDLASGPNLQITSRDWWASGPSDVLDVSAKKNLWVTFQCPKRLFTLVLHTI